MHFLPLPRATLSRQPPAGRSHSLGQIHVSGARAAAAPRDVQGGLRFNALLSVRADGRRRTARQMKSVVSLDRRQTQTTDGRSSCHEKGLNTLNARGAREVFSPFPFFTSTNHSLSYKLSE